MDDGSYGDRVSWVIWVGLGEYLVLVISSCLWNVEL